MSKKQSENSGQVLNLIEDMPLNIRRLEGINRSPGWHSHYHSHDFFEICYLVKGKGTISVEGITYKVKPGDIFFHKPGEKHKGKTFVNDPYELLVIGLDLVNDHLQFILFENASKLLPELDGTEKRNIQEIFENLLKETKQKDVGHRVLVKALLMEMFVVIVRAMLGQDRDIDHIPRIVNPYNKELSKRVIKYLTMNYRERLTLKKIAGRFYLSPYHFSRIFKQETSVSPMKYLTKIRIREAAKLLFTTNRAIKVIAYEVGFHDPYYFSKVFKNAYGLTPTQYRSTGNNLL